MEELNVIVSQTPGAVVWNFEDLKAALSETMKEYEGRIYTDDSIQAAKSDVTALRKLKNAVEARRKEIKNTCLEPYNIIEAQAKELTALIDKPINLIADQVKSYEDAQREARKKEIVDFMDETFKGLDQVIATRLKFLIYDDRWANVSTAKKTWKDAITDACDKVNAEVLELHKYEEDVTLEALREYEKKLSLIDAIKAADKFIATKQAILEAEKRKQEEEQRRAEEERIRREEAEAKRRADLAALREQLEQPKTAAVPEKSQTDTEKDQPVPKSASESAENIPNVPKNQPVAPERGNEAVPEDRKLYYRDVRIIGTKEQINKALGYLKYIGGRYEVRQHGTDK